jgi:hypothetical protein
MERPRLLRWVRIAVSALCLTACMPLVALWVRSYWYEDLVRGPFSKSNSWYSRSEAGWLTLGLSRATKATSHWSLISQNIEERHRAELAHIAEGGTVTRWPPRFGFRRQFRAYYLYLPHWFVLLMIATFAVLPWIGWSKRFSLRTLLIATMLVAVGLGIVVALR